MEIRSNLDRSCHRVDNAFAHIRRVGRRETNAFDTVDCCRFAQEVGKVVVPVAVRVDGLTKIDDLFIPVGSEFLDLMQEGVQWNTAFPASDVGNDTKSAELIAPPHHGHPGANALSTYRGNVRVCLVSL